MACMKCGGAMKKGGATPPVKKIKKMAVGGIANKKLIKKNTGGMYGIPQENMGTSGQYGFAKKVEQLKQLSLQH